MKNILTLLFSLMLVTAAFAQTDAQRDEAKRVILGEKKGSSTSSKTDEGRSVVLGRDNRTVYGERYPTTTSREQRINEINRAYDAKIYSIRMNRNLSPSEKDRIIRQLEDDRRREINAVNNSYYSKGKHDRDDDFKKMKKGNNGNHYGWEKGKGNPHKDD